MRLSRHRRWMAPVVAAAAVGLTLTACTGDIAEEDAADVDCADYEEYGTFDGAEITVGGTILDLEADRLVESWSDFETCTGISVDYQARASSRRRSPSSPRAGTPDGHRPAARPAQRLAVAAG